MKRDWLQAAALAAVIGWAAVAGGAAHADYYGAGADEAEASGEARPPVEGYGAAESATAAPPLDPEALHGMRPEAIAAPEVYAAAPEFPAPRWPRETLDLFASLPVQDGGRVKPLDTLAQFTLLRINGRRTFTTEEGERLSAIEWLLNCMFYPDVARHYKHFLVDTDEAITAIGVTPSDKKRDRYSYHQLHAGVDRLMQLATTYSDIEEKDRSRVQQQLVNLGNNVFQFQLISHYLDFARHRIEAAPGSAVAAALPEGGATVSQTLRLLPDVMRGLRERAQTMHEEALEHEVQALGEVFNQLRNFGGRAQGIVMIPNLDKDEKEWLNPAEVVVAALNLDNPSLSKTPLLASLERLAVNRVDRLEAAGEGGDAGAAAELDGAFTGELRELHTALTGIAAQRGEYDRIPLEVRYYSLNLLFYSQWLFVLSFLLVAVSWMLPNNRVLPFAVPAAVFVPLVLLTVAITIRCIIRGRPPVTTLYETLLFITAVAVASALVIEWMNRQRIAVATAAALGSIGLFLANKYEAKEGVDTMPSLIAVLDTNFWLSTHVTTVTTGYAAGLLAGALAHIYIFGRLFRFRDRDKGFYKSVSRMTYGSLCFCLLFSVVGTVLGGIWANDSWGRFWGWDPKENGALMICLWTILILHGRMGGYLRDLGIAVCSVILGMVVAFSWWGTNLLGVGLHSYGFTSGIWSVLVVFWVAQGFVALMGLLVWVLGRDKPAQDARVEAQARSAPAR